MNPDLNVLEAAKDECRRIEEDALYSAKGHFNAAGFWQTAHYLIGLTAAIAAFVAGYQAFQDSPAITATAAFIAGAFSICSTILNPQGKAMEHSAAGKSFNALKNNARVLREITAHGSQGAEIERETVTLSNHRNNLNQMSPNIPRRAHLNAKRDIEAGKAVYVVDKENDR